MATTNYKPINVSTKPVPRNPPNKDKCEHLTASNTLIVSSDDAILASHIFLKKCLYQYSILPSTTPRSTAKDPSVSARRPPCSSIHLPSLRTATPPQPTTRPHCADVGEEGLWGGGSLKGRNASKGIHPQIHIHRWR